MRCLKPAFPDSLRDLVGPVSLEVAANGQCFSSTGATFETYNALLSATSLRGAPSTASATARASTTPSGCASTTTRPARRRNAKNKHPTWVACIFRPLATTYLVSGGICSSYFSQNAPKKPLRCT
mgnify:CR=1 FL=1